MRQDKTYEKYNQECKRQDAKWGIRDQHPLVWMNILMEEIGEVSKEINESGFDTKKLNLENYETELVQCGAVITQMIKNIKYYKNEQLSSID